MIIFLGTKKMCTTFSFPGRLLSLAVLFISIGSGIQTTTKSFLPSILPNGHDDGLKFLNTRSPRVSTFCRCSEGTERCNSDHTKLCYYDIHGEDKAQYCGITKEIYWNGTHKFTRDCPAFKSYKKYRDCRWRQEVGVQIMDSVCGYEKCNSYSEFECPPTYCHCRTPGEDYCQPPDNEYEYARVYCPRSSETQRGCQAQNVRKLGEEPKMTMGCVQDPPDSPDPPYCKWTKNSTHILNTCTCKGARCNRKIILCSCPPAVCHCSPDDKFCDNGTVECEKALCQTMVVETPTGFVTTRGCAEPNRTLGCVEEKKGGLWTDTCVCQNDLCNDVQQCRCHSGPRPTPPPTPPSTPSTSGGTVVSPVVSSRIGGIAFGHLLKLKILIDLLVLLCFPTWVK